MWKENTDSIWLTAYVIQILSETRDIHIIDVDEKVITDGLKYIVGKQKKDGSFEDNSSQYRNLAPRVTKNYLTAFTLLALQKDRNLNTEVTNAADKTTDFIIREISKSTVDYDRSIAGYALALSNRKNESNIILSEIKHNYKNSLTKYQGLYIEIVSYLSLTSTLNNDHSSALGYVKWLNNQRVKNGGFPSSFDNYIALKSITEFLLNQNVANQNPHITLKLEQNGKSIKSLKVDNILDNKIVNIEDLQNTNFKFQFNGQGLAYANLWYQNTVDVLNDGIYFNVDAYLLEDNGNQKNLVVSLKRSNSGDPSNFVIMEVSLPSGFTYQSFIKSTNINVSFLILKIAIIKVTKFNF